ncbi:MAG: hypothetical protein J5604_01600 [Bacteroidales bacterium]|nr:hypothetical protein [Bacteroidales bacterium]
MDVMELESLVKESPWYSYARQILLEKLYRIDKEAFIQKLKECAVFLASRSTLYRNINNPDRDFSEEETIVLDASDKNENVTVEEKVEPAPKRRVIVAGGDFFSKEDLKSIAPEEDMELKLRNSPFVKKQADKSTVIDSEGKVNFDDLAFCTETLGHIYAQQGYNEQAIEVFSKLILLYPQKSAYFAALVNDLKTKNKE